MVPSYIPFHPELRDTTATPLRHNCDVNAFLNSFRRVVERDRVQRDHACARFWSRKTCC